MRALSPTLDHAMYSNEQERLAESQPYHLWVNETFEVTVESLIYQVQVDANLLRDGEHGDLEIADVIYQYIHVSLPQFGSAVLLDETNLREDHLILWSKLEAAVDFEMLKFGSRARRWEVA